MIDVYSYLHSLDIKYSVKRNPFEDYSCKIVIKLAQWVIMRFFLSHFSANQILQCPSVGILAITCTSREMFCLDNKMTNAKQFHLKWLQNSIKKK
jgi:hypothetical protein